MKQVSKHAPHRALAVMILAAAGGLAMLFVHQSREPAPAVYRPLGYYERVGELVEEGVLEFVPADQLQGASISSGNSWGRVRFVPDKASDHQLAFYQESGRLEGDIEFFNEEGSAGLFRVDGQGGLAVDPWTHNFQLPYPKKRGWSGSLAFREDPFPVLASGRLVLAFTRPEDPGRRQASDRKLLAAGEWLGEQGAAAHRAAGYDLQAPGGVGAVLRFDLVRGDKLVMECVEKAVQVEVSLNGVLVNRGRRKGMEELRERNPQLSSNKFEMRTGDRLRVLLGDSELVFRYGSSAGGTITRSWLENGEERTVVDGEVREQVPYLAEIHDAIQTFARQHPEPLSLGRDRVRLTIDRTLHSVLQQELEKFIEDFDARHSGVAGIEREPAAVTVMDALSGEVLAMPSYPTRDHIERWEQLALAGKGPRLSQAQKLRLRRNQNLAPIPIGSTTKPILAAAIWQTHRKLRDLVVDEPAKEQGLHEVLGHRLRSPLATVGRREVDAAAFFEKSSNAYMASLYFATLADPRSFKIGRDGRVARTSEYGRPDLSRYLRGDMIPGGLERDDLVAHRALAELFDVNLRQNLGAGQESLYDRELLGRLFERLGLDENEVPRPFWGVLPVETQLQLSTIDLVRSELISFLVGGYTNRWANVKLAEAYSRIGSGRRVRMTLVRESGAKRVAPRLELHQDVIDTIHQGMTASVESGTAVRLAGVVKSGQEEFAEDGLELRVLAKTGTARRRVVKATDGSPTQKIDCAAVCLYLDVREQRGRHPLAALSVTIYLQDRGTVREGAPFENSAVAVAFAKELVPHLGGWLRARAAAERSE